MCLPLHGEESVRHVVFMPLASVKLLCEYISHGALQQVWHLNIPVSVKNSVQSFTNATEAVEGQSSDTQPEDTKKKINRLCTHTERDLFLDNIISSCWSCVGYDEAAL